MTTQSLGPVQFVDPISSLPLRVERDGLHGGDQCIYPVVDGIPRFVESEAYTASFGLEWNAHPSTQLDSKTGIDISRKRLERALGAPLTSLEGKVVLEPGCGAGRFTEHLVESADFVYAFDMSTSVEAARRNLGERENLALAQADILHLPFPESSFDVIICLGTLPYTPSTSESLASLWRVLKPGGLLVVDHYVWELRRILKLDPLYRLVLTHLKPETSKAVSDAFVKALFPLHWATRQVLLGQALLTRVSPVYTYMRAYPDLSRAQQFEWSILDTYNHLTGRFQRVTTLTKMKRMLEVLGPSSVEIYPGGNGVEARAIKPG